MSYKKTTIWLSQEEIRRLDGIAQGLGVTRSALIRHAIRRMASPTLRQPPVPGDRPSPIPGVSPRQVGGGRRLTRVEHTVLALMNARYSDQRIARELGCSVERAGELRRSIEQWLDRV